MLTSIKILYTSVLIMCSLSGMIISLKIQMRKCPTSHQSNPILRLLSNATLWTLWVGMVPRCPLFVIIFLVFLLWTLASCFTFHFLFSEKMTPNDKNIQKASPFPPSPTVDQISPFVYLLKDTNLIINWSWKIITD